VKNRKVVNPVVFLWESFWPELKIDVCFLLKTIIMPIFSKIEESRTERCNNGREINDIKILLADIRPIFYFKKHAMTFLLYEKTSFESHKNSF
jgi:hypothetical protein